MATTEPHSTSNTPDHSHIQKHLELLQNIITRMANNSASCKTWCITLVAALLAASFSGDTTKISLILISILPIIAFAWLDSYYLYLENSFRKTFEEHAESIREGTYNSSSLYIMKIKKTEDGIINDSQKIGRGKKAFDGVKENLKSPSIYMFYGIQLITIFLVIGLYVFSNLATCENSCC